MNECMKKRRRVTEGERFLGAALEKSNPLNPLVPQGGRLPYSLAAGDLWDYGQCRPRVTGNHPAQTHFKTPHPVLRPAPLSTSPSSFTDTHLLPRENNSKAFHATYRVIHCLHLLSYAHPSPETTPLPDAHRGRAGVLLAI